MTDKKMLGRYELRGILGKGAMGVVYDAWDPATSSRVAIKTILLPDRDDAEAKETYTRFRREGQAAQRLNHPGIVRVFDADEIDGVAYIVMELVEGQSLNSLLAQEKRLTSLAAVGIMRFLLEALAYSHSQGVIHRDIKPTNIMLTNSGLVKIADFGIAWIESSSMTQLGTVIGTPAYMAPEQFEGQAIDRRTDIYAAGVLLYQLLTGERPFSGNPTALMHKVLHTTPPRPSELSVTAPEVLDPVVARAMARRPGDRYPSADAFAAALDAAMGAFGSAPVGAASAAPTEEATYVGPRLGGSPVSPPAANGAPPAPAREAPGRRHGVALGATAAAVLLAIGGWWFFPRSPVSRPTPKPVELAAVSPGLVAPPAPAPVVPPPVPEVPAAPVPLVPVPVVPAALVPSPVAVVPAAPAAPATLPTPTPAIPAEPRTAMVGPPVTTEPSQPPVNPAPLPSLPPVTVQPEPTRPPVAEDRGVATRLAAVDAALQKIACTALAASPGPDQHLTVTGLAGTGYPERAARTALKTAAGVNGVPAADWHVTLFDGPYCPVVDLMRRTASGQTRNAGGFDFSLGNRSQFRGGETFVPGIVAPPFPAHLRLSYFQSDLQVAHLFPDRDTPDRVFPPGAAVPLGTGWEIGPPFGNDMILAVMSSETLPIKDRPDEELAETYLAALGAAIEAAQRSGVTVVTRAVVLQTRQ